MVSYIKQKYQLSYLKPRFFLFSPKTSFPSISVLCFMLGWIKLDCNFGYKIKTKLWYPEMKRVLFWKEWKSNWRYYSHCYLSVTYFRKVVPNLPLGTFLLQKTTCSLWWQIIRDADQVWFTQDNLSLKKVIMDAVSNLYSFRRGHLFSNWGVSRTNSRVLGIGFCKNWLWKSHWTTVTSTPSIT